MAYLPHESGDSGSRWVAEFFVHLNDRIKRVPVVITKWVSIRCDEAEQSASAKKCVAWLSIRFLAQSTLLAPIGTHSIPGIEVHHGTVWWRLKRSPELNHLFRTRERTGRGRLRL